jgi:aldehyde dehydrogenase (NAD+)
VRHPKVEKITFTGGISTARQILLACAETVKPALLELGGKSANIVFADADLDAAARHATTFSLQVFSGQGCIFPTRLLVHREVYPSMVERCVALARAIPMGDPFDRGNTMGPVISFAAADRIVGVAERAIREGHGTLVAGGCRAGGALAGGAYVTPTVFADVVPSSGLAQEEVFGPVLSIMPFETEDEAIRIANDTPYGLGAYLHTRDVARVHRIAGELRAGGVFVNGGAIAEPDTPFGGVGASGYGREGAKVGIEEYLRMKTVSIAGSAGDR